MAFLGLYQNLSYFSLYKTEIRKLGIDSLLVFNIDGIPLIARDYSNNNVKTSQDFIFLSAFISSILKFVKVENNSLITDFGIGTSRFYLKFDINDTIYCLNLNELLHRRITGEQLIIFVETTISNLKKAFNYYRSDSSGIFKKEEFNEQFCLKIDRIFIDMFNQHISKAFASQNLSEYLFDQNILVKNYSSAFEMVKNRLLTIGIQGLLICGLGGSKPIILRNYEDDKIESFQGAYFICSLSHLLNKFALNNFGFFTDVGLGHKRVLFKFRSENDITVCLILSEVIYRRVSGESLTMFSELMLTKVHLSVQKLVPTLNEIGLQENSYEFESLIREKIDSVLLNNAKIIYEELQVEM